MSELIGLMAAIVACLAVEGALSIVHDMWQDDEPQQTFADCMDDVTEDIKQDVKRIRQRDNGGMDV